jgi:hypothetical protein
VGQEGGGEEGRRSISISGSEKRMPDSVGKAESGSAIAGGRKERFSEEDDRVEAEVAVDKVDVSLIGPQ